MNYDEFVVVVVLQILVDVDFQGTLGGTLPWTFAPEQKRITVIIVASK